jgi:hypothetical protein
VRRCTALILAVVTALTLAACGSSAESASPADVAAVQRQVADGNEFSTTQAHCVAEHATPKLSAKALKSAHAKGSSDLTKLPKADQEVIFTSVSTCVTTAQLAPALVKALLAGSDKVDATSAKCFANAVVKAYPDAGNLMRDLSAGKTSKFEKSLTACAVGSSDSSSSATTSSDPGSSGAGSDADSSIFKQAMVTEMTKGGLSATQANCVADKVVGELTASEVAGLSSSSSLPPAIETKVEAAVSSCVTGG